MHFPLCDKSINCGNCMIVMLCILKAKVRAHFMSDKVVLSHHAVNIVLKPASVNVDSVNLE